MGPLLFTIFINDFFFNRLTYCHLYYFILFSDDTNLFCSHSNPLSLSETINIELSKISQRMRADKLSLNCQKTRYMLLSRSIDSLPSNIFFDNNVSEDRTSY